MSNSVRAWVLLLVTLCLGIAIGVLGGGALQERRMARVDRIRRPGGFVEHAREVIQPTSDSQWNAIKPLIEAAAEQNVRMRRLHEGETRAALDSLKLRLEPMLDEAQRARFAKFLPGRGGPPGRFGPERGGARRGRGRGPEDRGGPPDGPPPPRDERGPPPPP